ncbi:platelet-activating factor acetylhydrolase IB subunit gamma [Cladorrhinum sp. PSN332]|nr:platelet-activating factor acetylhydrolase IB subunit gamma [Cladorrhinum sp. PSN332]
MTPSSLRTELQDLLSPISKYKLRSHETSLTSHIPLLQSCTTPPAIILLGDSTLERFITTGNSPNYTEPWPSPTLLPTLPPHSNRLPRVLNCGVGGDKIQNVAYRLLGDPSRDLPSLLAEVVSQQKIVKSQVWVIHAGTNNLTPKNGLSDKDVDALEVMLRVLLRIRGTRVILSGIMYRKDVEDQKVDEANEKLVLVVRRLQNDEEKSEGRISWLGPPEGGLVKKEEHLVDHVHLNLEGYRIWVGEILFPDIVRVLSEVEEGSSGSHFVEENVELEG